MTREGRQGRQVKIVGATRPAEAAGISDGTINPPSCSSHTGWLPPPSTSSDTERRQCWSEGREADRTDQGDQQANVASSPHLELLKPTCRPDARRWQAVGRVQEDMRMARRYSSSVNQPDLPRRPGARRRRCIHRGDVGLIGENGAKQIDVDAGTAGVVAPGTIASAAPIRPDDGERGDPCRHRPCTRDNLFDNPALRPMSSSAARKPLMTR